MRTGASFQTGRRAAPPGLAGRVRVPGRAAAVGLLVGGLARRVGVGARRLRPVRGVVVLHAFGVRLRVAALPGALLARVVGVVGAAALVGSHARVVPSRPQLTPTVLERERRGTNDG